MAAANASPISSLSSVPQRLNASQSSARASPAPSPAERKSSRLCSHSCAPCVHRPAWKSTRPAARSPLARAVAATSAGVASRRSSQRWPSGTWPRHTHMPPIVIEASRSPASGLREVIDHSSAARTLSSSRSRRSSQAAWSSPSRCRSASSASSTAQFRCASRTIAASPVSRQLVESVLPERLEQPVSRSPAFQRVAYHQ